MVLKSKEQLFEDFKYSYEKHLEFQNQYFEYLIELMKHKDFIWPKDAAEIEKILRREI